ncbi:TipAS antibiotic-recognition domain-containing protein [Bailinhaonella thermotolerans]|uniref:TipAS antibiotic-recognition domain-containing protein n=1 Tax=Bailinhaonella thermotolerans TaxID=1070861 RepID=A0A3A4AB05_9ACTN|nr:TipAS antibiotic-recognition domain-containing protein [Bailinhaonella thermotolerans]RJL23604.1 hypothetical protein D5H75_32390 [Bailinhaonella thermotolerans]
MNLTPEERAEIFGDHDPEQYADEARERWGDTDAYRESQRRAASYTKQDWRRIQEEATEITEGLAALLRAGVPADSAEATALAERHREHISRWFYECSPEFHRCLADTYVSDPRFTATYDQTAPGLARYVHDAIKAVPAAS